jgi:hypothetical protein
MTSLQPMRTAIGATTYRYRTRTVIGKCGNLFIHGHIIIAVVADTDLGHMTVRETFWRKLLKSVYIS